MKWGQSKKKTFTLLAATALIISGTYNSVMVNSDSFMNDQDVRFVKRLDEVYGVVKVGRQVANASKWVKLSNRQVTEVAKNILPRPMPQFAQVAKAAPAQAAEVAPTPAAIQEELDLQLVEVTNPKKYANALPASQFNGALVTNGGVLEELSISLPNGEGLSITTTEMVGNVFEYDLDGETLSGMIYQIDQSSYMVTLTNGAFEGTRMKFSNALAPVAVQPAQDFVADANTPVAGEFTATQAPVEVNSPDQGMQAAGTDFVEGQAAVQGFNLDNSQQAI